MTAGVGVGALLGARGAATGLDLDLLAGAAGLERRITLPYVQKTGLALSGFDDKSAKGVQRVVGIQLMFYVPAVGADEQIRLLGWSESLIGASEVP